MKDVASVSAHQKPAKSVPKVLEHIRIMPKMGGGVTVAHHYSSYEHEPKMHEFGMTDGSGFHEHIATHTGMPMDSEGETESEAPAGEK